MSKIKKYLGGVTALWLSAWAVLTAQADETGTNDITMVPYHPFTINVEGGTTASVAGPIGGFGIISAWAGRSITFPFITALPSAALNSTAAYG
jgi:hypothetical protein